MFQYVIETERRFYLANKLDLQMRNEDGDTYFDITLHDAWVWDMYRPARFVTRSGWSLKDVNIEELIRKEELQRGHCGVQRDPAVPGQEDGRHRVAGRRRPDRPGPAGLCSLPAELTAGPGGSVPAYGTNSSATGARARQMRRRLLVVQPAPDVPGRCGHGRVRLRALPLRPGSPSVDVPGPHAEQRPPVQHARGRLRLPRRPRRPRRQPLRRRRRPAQRHHPGGQGRRPASACRCCRSPRPGRPDRRHRRREPHQRRPERGPGELVKTIEQNFGVLIHHYVLIDFDGFQAIVDALGGIDVRFYPSRDVVRPRHPRGRLPPP